MQLKDGVLQLTTSVVPQEYLDLFTGTWAYIHGPQTHQDRAGNSKPGAVEWSTAKFKKKDGTKVPGKLTENIILDAIKKGSEAVGKRFGQYTRYLMLDIDRSSPYHPWELGTRFQELLGACEELGLVRPVLVRSSASGGLHVYFPMSEPIKTWSSAKKLSDLLAAHKFKVQDGWLELFPNPKTRGVDYKAHRLPLLLPDSMVVDEDLNPITDSLPDFMQIWAVCAEANATDYFVTENLAPLAPLDLALAQTNPAPRPSKRVGQPQQPAPAPVTTRAPATGKRGKRPLPAWTGPHCSNQTMRELANYGYEVLNLQTVSALADWMKKTAATLPGYQEFASPDARRDIEQGNWCERWAKSRIRKENGVFDCAGHDLNAERAADAKARLAKLVEMLAGKTFETLRSVVSTLIDLGKEHFGKGFSWDTILKYRDLIDHLIKPTHPEANTAQPTAPTVDQRERSVAADGVGVSGCYTPPPGQEKPALEQVGFYLHDQDVTAPAVIQGLLSVPEALWLGFKLVNQDLVVPPGDLCSASLHNF
jgi:hypothetical protein